MKYTYVDKWHVENSKCKLILFTTCCMECCDCVSCLLIPIDREERIKRKDKESLWYNKKIVFGTAVS